MASSTRGMLVVPVLALLALIAIDRTTSRHGDPVAVIGDSITALGADVLNHANDGAFQLTISGRFGDRAQDKLGDATQLADAKPKQVIIELGSNDAIQGTPLDDTRKALTEIVALFPKADCIHLVTVNTAINYQGKQPAEAAAKINAVISDLAVDSRIDVIDFGRTLSDAVTESKPLGLTTDGVHPNAEGRREQASEELHALERCERSWQFW